MSGIVLPLKANRGLDCHAFALGTAVYDKSRKACLAYGFHVLKEDRQGLLAEFDMHNPIKVSQPAIEFS